MTIFNQFYVTIDFPGVVILREMQLPGKNIMLNISKKIWNSGKNWISGKKWISW